METTIVYWDYIGIMEKRMETTIVYWDYIGIMEKRMETTVVYWDYIGIMENKMETTIVGVAFYTWPGAYPGRTQLLASLLVDFNPQEFTSNLGGTIKIMKIQTLYCRVSQESPRKHSNFDNIP